RVGILFMMLAIGAYLVWKNLGGDSEKGGQELFVRMKDASALPTGSKVVVAGLRKGEVTKLEVRGRYAVVYFTLSKDIPIWSNAVVYKKASSLLGENYLEIDPGEPFQQKPDGSKLAFTPLGNASTPDHPKCADYDSSNDQKRWACREIPHMVEAVTPDELIHRIEATLPRVDTVLESVHDLSEDVRRIVNGPMKNVADRVDGLVQKQAQTVESIIERADRMMANVEQLTKDVRAITADADPKVAKILADLEQASAEAKDLVATAKQELKDTGDAVRGKLDKLDGVMTASESIAKKIDEDKGTLGRLVNDPAIADNVESITEDAKGFLGTLFGLKAYVGLRSEWNFRAGLARHYVSVELHTRPDKFYLVELEKGPRGNYPDVSLVFDPTVDPNNWIKKTVIEDKIRFTFQFAKRFGWLTLRYGIKESTGGIGADADIPWMNRNIRLSADVFDATFDKYPRAKLTAAMEVFKHVYVLGGVDELLNDSQTLPIIAGNSEVPVQFEEFRFGRDYFLGGMLRFTDEDLAALLTVGGSAIAGAGGK
ncbi:MAG TPA: MlaD family protein, partial [Kofleriaceae bacterium]|nr:MlaD family protein [Kofleriaceae bacterium]